MFKKIYTKIDTRAFDIGWWNEKVLIITRGTGILTLCSSHDLSDLMGQNQEWLNPYAHLYSYPKNGFLVLDVSYKKKSGLSYKILKLLTIIVCLYIIKSKCFKRIC
jgi:hypothetical protein